VAVVDAARKVVVVGVCVVCIVVPKSVVAVDDVVSVDVVLEMPLVVDSPTVVRVKGGDVVVVQVDIGNAEVIVSFVSMDCVTVTVEAGTAPVVVSVIVVVSIAVVVSVAVAVAVAVSDAVADAVAVGVAVAVAAAVVVVDVVTNIEVVFADGGRITISAVVPEDVVVMVSVRGTVVVELVCVVEACAVKVEDTGVPAEFVVVRSDIAEVVVEVFNSRCVVYVVVAVVVGVLGSARQSTTLCGRWQRPWAIQSESADGQTKLLWSVSFDPGQHCRPAHRVLLYGHRTASPG